MKLHQKRRTGKTAEPDHDRGEKSSSFATAGEEASGLWTDHPRGPPRPAQAVHGPGASSPSPFHGRAARARDVVPWLLPAPAPVEVEVEVEVEGPELPDTVAELEALRLSAVEGNPAAYELRPTKRRPLVERLTDAIRRAGLARDLAQVWAQKVTRDGGLLPTVTDEEITEIAAQVVEMHARLEAGKERRSKDGEAPGSRGSWGEARSAEGPSAPGPGVWGQSPHRKGSHRSGASTGRLVGVLGLIAAIAPHFERMVMAAKSTMMLPKVGPAQKLDAGKDWTKAPSGEWYLITMTAAAAKHCEHKGKRVIDGKPYAVFLDKKTGAHVGQPIDTLMESAGKGGRR